METEFGLLACKRLALATHAYTQSYEQFESSYIPIIASAIATAPLTDAQLDSIGIKRRELLGAADYTNADGYFYAALSRDHRLVINGGHALYYA